MERNPNYWNKGLPYVDRLEIYNLPPFSPELGAATLLTSKIDYGRILDPVTWRRSKETPGMSVGRAEPERHPGGLHEQPRSRRFNDPRVRRAHAPRPRPPRR